MEEIYRIDMNKVIKCWNPFKKLNALFRIIFLMGLDFRNVENNDPLREFLSIYKIPGQPKPLLNHLPKRGKKKA